MIDSWLDRVSLWIEQKEPVSQRDEALLALREVWDQTSSEADAFFHSSSCLEKAFSEIAEKAQNAAP